MRLQASQVAIGEAHGEAGLRTPQTAPRAPRQAPPLGMLPSRPRAGEAAIPSTYIFQQCWHCEPGFGREDPKCVAVAKLEALADDLGEARRRVAEGEVRKNARYLLYRAWVGDYWGYLGRGNRIEIPPCVVEYIRDMFREPDCNCLKGGPLYACTAHGYTGHRDA